MTPAEYHRAWRKKHPRTEDQKLAVSEKAKQDRKNNPEKYKLTEAQKEKYRINSREYRKTEDGRRTNKKWRAENREKVLSTYRKYETKRPPRPPKTDAQKARDAVYADKPHRKETRAAERARPEVKRREYETFLKRTYYGFTLEDLAWLAHSQGFSCAVCKRELKFDVHTHLDHDHENKRIRGILCRYCNNALGYAFDSPTRLLALANYVEQHAFPFVIGTVPGRRR